MGSEIEPDSEVSEISLQLRDLTITIRRRPGSSSSFVGHSPSRESLAGSIGPPGTSPSPIRISTRLPGDLQASAWTAEWREALLRATTAEELLVLDLSPIESLGPQLTHCAAGWSPRARLARALRAGVSAGLALERDPGSVVASPVLGLPARIYVVLRAAPPHSPGWTSSFALYRQRVQGSSTIRFHPSSVSHGFPSRAEAEAYLRGAGVGWPHRYETQN